MITLVIKLVYDAVTNFSTQLIICELMLCMGLHRRLIFWGRILTLLPLAAIPVLYRWATGEPIYQLSCFCLGWFPCSFSLWVLASSLLLWFCFDDSYWRILFFSVAAHIIQNMIYMMELIVQFLLFSGRDNALLHLTVILLNLVAVTLTYLLLARRLTSRRVDVDNRSLLAFTVTALLVVNILNYWIYSFSYQSLATYVYQLVCCILLLTVQFGIFDRSLITQEHMIMERMYQERERQYKLSQENIDIINRKCHDMKHQLALLRNSRTMDEREHGLQDIEDAMMIYDTSVQTGNQILDTLLTEKSLQCENHQINISCLVDGQLLGFMDNTDLYSLFGNALDNAIESVLKEMEANRIISLCVTKQAGGVLISLDNYCSRAVQFQNGLPLTSKENNGYHGFGTRSIQYVSQKYGGTVIMKHIAEECRFSLTILFPR